MWSHISNRTRLLTGLIALAALVTVAPPRELVAPPGATGVNGSGEVSTAVIVRAGAVDAAAQAVHLVGGTVTRRLDLIGGVAAQVPASALRRLSQGPGVTAVSPDVRGRLLAYDSTLGYDPTGDFGSLYNVTQVANVQSAWKSGYTGKGVDVALIDSGVSETTGLTSGNVVNGPDLSLESPDPAVAHRDTFGHGTHMAGIIAGRDAVGTPKSYADPQKLVGVAPDARLINIKVAAADGGVDVSQVIAALGWATQHAHDPGLNIRVVNLSFGTDSTQSYLIDPLAYAAEAAWRNGIVVVVAGGNDGTNRPTLSDPAIDPSIIAVGGEDPMGTVTTSDDTVPAFASHGTTGRHVDLVAPAVHVISLRDPGSEIDLTYPEGRVGTRFFRGSGTSQSTAVVSGAVAVLLQKYPKLTPDQVKKLLMTTAAGFPGASSLYRGSGALNLGKALTTVPPLVQSAASLATGTGSLDASRGSARISDSGVDLIGEQDIFGRPFVSATWAPLALAKTSWLGGMWNGNTWTGVGWTDTSWLGATWAGVSWTGADWAGVTWSSHSWTSHSWTSNGWDGGDWTSHSWTSHSWTASTWAGYSWN